MSKRLPGGLLRIVVLLATVAAVPALVLVVGTPVASAVEAEGTEQGGEAEPVAPEELPDISQFCAEDTPSAEFCPDPYEEPSWFQWPVMALLGAGVIMTFGLLFFYLVWQPRFAREREAARKR